MDHSFFKEDILDISTVRNFIFFKRLDHVNIYKPSIKIKGQDISYLNEPKKDILTDDEEEDVLEYLKSQGIKYKYSTKTQITDFSSCITFKIKHINTTFAKKHMKVLKYFLDKWLAIGLQISFFKYFYGLHQYYLNICEDLGGTKHVHYCTCFFSIILGFFYDRDINLEYIIQNFGLKCSVEELKKIFIIIFIKTDFNLLHEGEFPEDIDKKDIYEILEQLGKGSYGSVFKVYKDEEIYAMKVGQLNDEISILNSISSPYVVKVYNYGKKWFVMNLKKRSLQSHLPQNSKNIIKQLLQGLSDIHKAGIVHMDVKPSNILIDEEENITYIDFGISLKQGNKVSLGASLWYRAPELLKGVYIEASPSMDIWSLGCIIYEIVTGEVLFCAENETQLMQKIMNHQLFEDIQYCDLLNDMIRRLDKRLSAEELLQKHF